MTRIRAILHPTDFSVHSDLALQVACSLARASGGRLTVLHVGSIPQLYQKRGYREELEQALRRRAASDPGTPIDWLLLAGDAAAEILWLAQERQYDLVVMGTHGRTGLDRLLTGSVAAAVLRDAPCPVLTVKVPPLGAPRLSPREPEEVGLAP
jgi:nucleotide-binding universal stress UspA family protein